MQEVRLRAKRLGINSFGKKKADLIREIQRAEGNFDCFGTAEGYCDQFACVFRKACVGTENDEEIPAAKERGAGVREPEDRPVPPDMDSRAFS
jgi:hypothetical protein